MSEPIAEPAETAVDADALSARGETGAQAETSAAPTASGAAPGTTGALPRPRIRVGAVLWGLVLVALAAAVLWTVATPARRSDALETVLTLSPLGGAVIIIVTLGATITLLALAAVLRRLQRR
ncbi:MAG: hypothetical protein QM675_11800 [Protaetiibacter sp.]